MSDLNCKKLYEELAWLKELKVEFDRAYEEGLAKKNFSGCAPLYRQMKDLMRGDGSFIKRIREFRELIELLDLEAQYESQVEVAWNSGLFKDEVGNNSLLPVIERDGKEYKMPDWREVKRQLFRNIEMVREKAEQGFTKMLIVPFASSLKDFESGLRWTIRSFEDSGRGVFSTDGDRISFKQDEDDLYPLIINYTDDQLVYYPKKYDPKNHGGMTKTEVIDSKGAWQICFVEDMSQIPDFACEEVGGRLRLDKRGTGLKMNQGKWRKEPSIEDWHRAMFNKNEFIDADSYRHEEGMVIEQYAWMQLTNLLEGQKPVLSDCDDSEYSGVYLLNSYDISRRFVATVDWRWEEGLVMYNGDSPDFSYASANGIRSIVNLK